MNERAADWNPTEEQFQAYQHREIELAVTNLHNVRGHAEMTLHSPQTVAKVRALFPSLPNPGIGR